METKVCRTEVKYKVTVTCEVTDTQILRKNRGGAKVVQGTLTIEVEALAG
jgi:hypothetical protein